MIKPSLFFGRFKKGIAISILIAVFFDFALLYFFLENRLFSHLALWNIIEYDNKNDFYWHPENAPAYFKFNRPTEGPEWESWPIYSSGDDFQNVLEASRYAMVVFFPGNRHNFSLKWDSPDAMFSQIKKGIAANCFYRSILFSSYLSNVGIKSRLWALENERFDSTAHTVIEVYIKSIKKWVFFDLMFGFYASREGVPVSFLEFREEVLKGGIRLVLHNLDYPADTQKTIPPFYRRLVKCVFLRSGNDFINKYKIRYGLFNRYKEYIDRLSNKTRMGIDYLFGRKDFFIHYADSFSGKIATKAAVAKVIFYSLIFFPFFALLYLCLFLKRSFPRNISRKYTFHK